MLGHFFEIKYHPPPCPIHRLFSFFPFKNQSQYISLIVSHHSFSVILPDSILPDTSYPHCSFKSRFPIVALCIGRRWESSPKRRCSPIFSCLPITSHPLSRSIHVSPQQGVVTPPLCLPPPGILHKGTGENQFLTQQPAIITSIMGNGRRRSISCPSCNGLAEGNKLLAPVALAVGIDGSLFVGDFNYIRRIFPSRNVTSILELR